MERTYKISGMHCGKCMSRVSEALAPYADGVSVTLTPQRATLTNPRTSDLRLLGKALSKAGTYTIDILDGPPPLPLAADDARPQDTATYYPLLVIAAYIAVTAFAGAVTPGDWMTNFMAGFFLVFSAFKFLNLSGFADAYAGYDLLARRWHGYGYIYPFIELALGLAYLFRIAPEATNWATLAVMGFSSLGVLNALSNKQRIQCACLGTVLKLPMSSVTLVEDLTMVAMAAFMLLTGSHN